MITLKRWRHGLIVFILLSLFCAGNAFCDNQPAFSGQSLNRVLNKEVRGEKIASGTLAVVTDGVFAPEGAQWNVPESIVSEKDFRANVIIDLTESIPLRAFILQSDWNDIYFIEGSNDSSSWKKLWVAPKVGMTAGLRTRRVQLPESTDPYRYIRVRGANGDDVISISEFQAYSVIPDGFDSIGPQQNIITSYYWIPGLTVENVDQLKQILLIIAIGLFAYANGLNGAGYKSWIKWAFGGLSLVSFLLWSNVLQFHYEAFVHKHEFFHYFLGAKYHNELSYSRLYRCATLADYEEGALKSSDSRSIRNLIDNQMEESDFIISNPDECKKYFTPLQWTHFKNDVTWFRTHMPSTDYEEIYSDHGFNGTPVWLIAGSQLSRIGVASESFINILGSLDMVLMGAAFLYMIFTFGIQNSAAVIIFWGCNFIASFAWTGNGFLRADWLFFCVMTICLLKREKYALAGMTSVAATFLRIFPVLLPFGLVMSAAYSAVQKFPQTRKITLSPAMKRYFGGLIIGGAVLLSLSILIGNGISVWEDFYANTVKHYNTASTNMMGLENVIAQARSTFSPELKDPLLIDQFSEWRENLIKYSFSNKIIFFSLLLFIGFAATRLSQRLEIWESAIIFLGLCSLIRLANYDYYFMILFGLFYDRKKSIPIGLLFLAVLSWHLAVLFGEEDPGYFSQSVCVIVFVLFSLLTIKRSIPSISMNSVS